MVSWTIRTLVLAIALVAPNVATAQTNPPLLKPAQLDQLVAPIALYPDPLLAEVLMASAYPLDIVEAERWLQANKNLKGDELKAALEKQDWDDSVKSLVATPSVLEMMSTKLDWTQKLGDAVVAQQPDVMDAIQRLRAKAQANNKLTSNKQQTVTVGQVQGQQVIAIEPTDADTVYVPYYDPAVVYGRGLIRTTRHIIGSRLTILAQDSSRRGWPSGPDTLSRIGVDIGGVASIGAAAVTTLSSNRLETGPATGPASSPATPSPMPATNGSLASSIGKRPAIAEIANS